MRLKEIREAKGISQRQAAIGLNLSPTVYNRYENGIREPSSIVLIAMADYFGVTVDDLLGHNVVSTDEWNPDSMNYAEKENESINLMARGMKRMTEENRQKLLDMARIMFKEDFDGQGNKKNAT